MCLIAVSWKDHPRYSLALIANRDEFHGRPAAPAARDPQRPDLYGGRDLQAGGSWLLVSTRGRLAAVTNVRAGVQGETAPRSRGALVQGFVEGTASAAAFVDALAPVAAEHGRYNLLAWDGAELQFASNQLPPACRSRPPWMSGRCGSWAAGAAGRPWNSSRLAISANR